MISTIQIKPAKLLLPFINCYALRIFNTGNIAMPKPFHAVPDYYMTFFLSDRFCTLMDAEGKRVNRASNSLTTLFTQSQGCSYWQGNYRVFCVQFSSNGVSSIFGIPQKILINSTLPAEDILGHDSELLTEQFAECRSVTEMSLIMNAYLLKRLLKQKQKAYTNTIAAVSNIIQKEKGLVSLDSLVRWANMSFRNFERRFSDEVGISPKLYTRITRFYNALENKSQRPDKSWLTIAHENGYFDQAHFIKECREFSDKPPDEFFRITPMPKENFIDGASP